MQQKFTQLFQSVVEGHTAAIARAITLIENQLEGSDELLQRTKSNQGAPIIGITGSPGAGKSTLTEALLQYWVSQNKRIAVLAVDPSSPFNFGALLGDRIRMSRFYNNPDVYIRSLSSRGALGGLHPRIWEITELLKAAPFDFIIIETVGVGQSEVDIAGLADCTVVTLVPEGGDEVQTIKAGIMEIANVFAINKSDRPGAQGTFVKVKALAHERSSKDWETPVVKTVATDGTGVEDLAIAINAFLKKADLFHDRKLLLTTEKIWHIIQRERMKDLDKKEISRLLKEEMSTPDFNWYSFALKFV